MSPFSSAHRSDSPILRGNAARLSVTLTLALLMLLPVGILGSTGGPPRSATPALFVVPAASLSPRWSSAPGPSQIGTALPVGTVDLRDLPSTAPSVSLVPPPTTSTPPPFLLRPPSAGAFPAHIAPTLQAVGTGFEGLNDSQCGCAPPDVIDAAGPTQVVEMVNLWMEVWTKSGVPVHGASAPSFFGSGSDFLSDPRVVYDNGSGRWFASIFDAGPSGTGLVRFAVSATADAAGTWKIYTSVTAPSGDFPDQPILGVSDHLLAFGGNMFSESSSAFVGAEYWVVDKAAVLNGSSASVQRWGPDPNYLSIHPIQSLGSTSTQYFASSTSASPTTVALWAVTGIPPSASSLLTNLTVASYTTAPAGRAPGGGLIDSADTRVQVAVWQLGDLWLAFDDQCTPSGDSSARACVRVIEVATSSAEVLQDFDYGIAGLDLFYPSIALDRAGDMTMVFGYSSSSVDPSGGVTGQATTDPVGSLEAYRTVVAGTATLNCGGTCRYGDYFGAGADPTDSTVWVSAEFMTPAHTWDSWIAPVVTTGPASAVLASAPTATDVGFAVTIGLTGANVTCSPFFGLYCAASVPLGDGTTVSSPCSATPPTFSWSHGFATVGIYQIGLGGYLSEYTTPSCTPGTEILNLTLTPHAIVVSSAPALELFTSPTNGADVGESIALSAVTGGGRSPFTFVWSGLPIGCAASPGPSINCTATSTGSSLITVTATDANGVNRAQSLPFVVSPALTTSMAVTRTVLDVGQEVTLVATAQGGSGSYGYAWTGLPTGCYGTNLSNLACTPTGPGTFVVQQLTQDSNGASALSATIALTVEPALEITLSIPSGSVAGSSAVLQATVTGGSAPYSLSWYGLPGACATVNSTQLSCTPGGSGSWSVEVAVVDSLGGNINATGTWSVSGAPSGVTLSFTEAAAIVGIALVAIVAIALVLLRRRPNRPPRGPA